MSGRSDLHVVVLAAGIGKRMRSSLPKVLHPLAGRPLLEHVVSTASALEPASGIRPAVRATRRRS